ncbi:MAG: DUF58 domain-containing protein [Zoogloeaceae bacterium]|nr:DUF58 domain-containing protein [Zoogloeaceae bacterium]
MNLLEPEAREAASGFAVPAPGALRPQIFLSSVRPTAAGLFWLLAALALLAVAINYGNNLVFALAFLLFSLWLSAAWECRRNLAGLEWQAEAAIPVFAGENLHPGWRLRDPAGRGHEQIFLEGGLRGELGKRKRRVPARQGMPVDLPTQAGGALESVRIELALPAPVRGRHAFQCWLVSLHPLGLWRARRALPDAAALVYPRPAGELPLPDAAPRPAHERQEADDFQGVRAYAPGDSPRRVNWRVFARREELTVNYFDGGEGGRILWLDIAACPGNRERALSQLCQWVLMAEEEGLEYGLRLEGEAAFLPARGRAHRDACLRRLAEDRISGNRGEGTGDENIVGGISAAGKGGKP